MSSERELLAAAARAAGKDTSRWTDGNEPCGGGPGFVQPDNSIWNARMDSGQALELAIKLQLTICNEHVSAGEVYCIRGQNEVFPSVQSGTTEDGDVIPSDYPATRRAIVLAAAAIDAIAAKGRR